MKLDFLPEPELEFAGYERHIDIRQGLVLHGPLDHQGSTAPTNIRVGVVGSPQSVEGLCSWLEHCRSEIGGKQGSRQPNLFPAFPGCRHDAGLRSSIILASELHREIPQRQIADLIKSASSNDLVREAAKLFIGEFEYLVQNTNVDILMCAWPFELLEAMEPSTPLDMDDVSARVADQGTEETTEEDEDAGADASTLDFHDLLKAKGMTLRKPMQVVRPSTYDETMLRKQRNRDKLRQVQDEATRAWNIHTALYYKAGGTPWRLVRNAGEYETCYVGISFYKSLDGSKIMTSVAQIFNQRGEGVVLRGGKAKLTKDDKRPYLETADAYKLLADTLDKYKETHKHPPARIVLHKTSRYVEEEQEGLFKAAADKGIELVDMVYVSRTNTRLFRAGVYPPRRGTLLMQDASSHVLYTRGSVEYYKTYPGTYPPLPLSLTYTDLASSPKFVASEVLALTKMNWNNTQFDNADPMTIRAAKQVGSLLKYLDEDDFMEFRYSFYM